MGQWTPEAEIAGMQRKSYRTFFTSSKTCSREPFQLPPGTGGAGRTLVNIELHHFVARHSARVFDVHGSGQRPIGVHRRGVDLEVGEAEAGVAQSVAEGIKR